MPSQLESLVLLCTAAGVEELGYIDGTPDGFAKVGGATKFSSMEDFFEKTEGPYIAMDPGKGANIRDLKSSDGWFIFGPSMGLNDVLPEGIDRAHIPGGVLNSRDAVPIVVWELAWER